jgi:hypothetical protein
MPRPVYLRGVGQDARCVPDTSTPYHVPENFAERMQIYDRACAMERTLRESGVPPEERTFADLMRQSEAELSEREAC